MGTTARHVPIGEPPCAAASGRAPIPGKPSANDPPEPGAETQNLAEPRHSLSIPLTTGTLAA